MQKRTRNQPYRSTARARRATRTARPAAPSALASGRCYLPLHALGGKRVRSRWGELKFRPSPAAFGARLRASIWVRNIRGRSKRVFLFC